MGDPARHVPTDYCHSRCPTHRTYCALKRDHTTTHPKHIGGMGGCTCTWEIGYVEDVPLTLPGM